MQRIRPSIRGYRPKINDLEKHLEQAIHKHNLVETEFRARHVHRWTVLFCDVSKVLNQAVGLNIKTRKALVEKYRTICDEIIESYDPPFNSKDEGPQVLACFDNAEEACEAAIAIQYTFISWQNHTDGRQYFHPAIGLHTGDFVVKDGELKQSNACNLGKRIQTEAGPGNIFISSSTNEEVALLNRFDLNYERTAMVKNIPEPQKIYNLEWEQDSDTCHRESTGKKKGSLITVPKEEDEVLEGYMGLLVCDVAGSSKKFWHLGDREGNMLIDMYRKEVFPILLKFHAQSVEISEGDQITATFSANHITNTTLAAIQIQKDLFRRNVNMAERERFKLNVSIGLHCGDLTVHNNKVIHNETFYTGKAIQDDAEANEIYISGEMQRHLSIYSKMFMNEIGETQVKGTDIVVPVYALQWHRSGL